MTPHWPSFDKVQRQRDAMREIIADLSDRTLRDLLRRAGESPRPLEEGAGSSVSDGYPSTSGESDIHSGRMANPTAAAALRDYVVDPKTGEFVRWKEPFDPVGDSLVEFFALLAEANGVLRQVDRKLSYLRADRDAATRGPPPAPPGGGMCEACTRVVTGAVKDKLVSGYCKACRKKWERARYPDRVQFAKQVQNEIKAPAEEGTG